MDISARYKHVLAMYAEATRLRDQADRLMLDAAEQEAVIRRHCKHEFIFEGHGAAVPICGRCGQRFEE